MYQLANQVVETIKLMIIMCGILRYQMKEKKKILAVFTTVWIGALFATGVFKWNEGETTVLTGIIVICTIIICIKGKYKALVTAVAYFALCLLDMIIAWVMIEVFRLDYGQVVQHTVVTITENIICILILSTMYFIQKRKRYKLNNSFFERNEIILIGALVFFISFFMVGLQQEVFQIPQYSKGYILTVTASISGIFLLNLCVSFLINNNERKQLMEKNQINEELLNSQSQYYQKVMQMNDELRKIRHDINNHLYSMQILLEKKDYMEMEQYLQHLTGKITETKVEVETGVELVNAIVMDLSRSHDKVKILWEGRLALNMRISLFDICIIFSNLLKNAVEAVEQLSDGGLINVTVRYANNGMVVGIQNPTAGQVKIKWNRIETSKKDKKNHGIGLENVERCVKKYDGYITYRNEVEGFRVEVIMPNMLQEKKTSYLQK